MRVTRYYSHRSNKYARPFLNSDDINTNLHAVLIQYKQVTIIITEKERDIKPLYVNLIETTKSNQIKRTDLDLKDGYKKS